MEVSTRADRIITPPDPGLSLKALNYGPGLPRGLTERGISHGDPTATGVATWPTSVLNIPV
ncbi:hypothetical protein RvY_14058 [Ramazzottius varieornatus]|uniref:Uncharacterized protein n=1 Tax=Ramazzottius varieornatus TaxID=947166 RepID=A0A1D1VXC1_RAMVA|nr:hypothetical protein RvY_14058 [Ramazzottius varieornatus]